VREDIVRNVSLALFATLLATPLIAQEKPINLKKAPGLDMVEKYCARATASTTFR